MAGLQVYPKLAQLNGAKDLLARWAELGCGIPCDDRIMTAAEGSPLAQPITVFGRRLGNRWCIHPMEGWDGTPDGRPSDWTRRRWEAFRPERGKLIWAARRRPSGTTAGPTRTS